MNSTSGSDTLVKEVRINAAPQTVFGFFTDPAKVVQWKGVTASIDPRPGGVYNVTVTPRDVAVGEFVEVTPYTRVVFTFGWQNSPIPPGSTTVEVLLIPDGEGTVVRLTHRGLEGEAVQQHGDGWDHYLSRLVAVANGEDPGVDPWVQMPPEDVTHAPVSS